MAALERAGVRVGVAAVRLPEGELLAEHRAREAFLPASNQKLLALAAALHGLGAEHEFVTRFAVHRGALVVAACGDPNWTTGGAHDPVAIMAAVAARLQEHGIAAVRDVVLDPGTLTGPSRPGGWRIYDPAVAWCPPTGALVLDAGCFEAVVAVRDGAGRAVIDIVAPPVPLPIEGSIAVTPDKKKGAVYGLAAGSGGVRAWGALWNKAGSRRVRGALPEGDAIALRALRECLVRAGVAIRADAPEHEVAELFEYRTRLADALPPMMHDSSNFHAEQVARALGAARHGDGSCAGAARAVAAELRALVGAWPEVTIDDAAGLSRDNRVSPGFLVTVLGGCAAQPWGETFVRSLPCGGQGTLERRFTDVPFTVRAKTGTLRDASALAGYVDVPDGGRIAFAVLVNLVRGRAAHPSWRQAQDRIVATLAEL